MTNVAYKKYSIYLLLSLLTTFVGTVLGGYLVVETITPFAIASVLLIFVFLYSKGTVKKVLFFVFCLGEGILLNPILYYYTKTSVVSCLLLVVVTTTIFMVIGMKVRDLGFLRGILFNALIVLIVYGLISIFMPLPSIAIIGAIVFCGYIAFDMNRFKQIADSISDDEILNEVMNMYLNIINLFLYILKLFGKED